MFVKDGKIIMAKPAGIIKMEKILNVKMYNLDDESRAILVAWELMPDEYWLDNADVSSMELFIAFAKEQKNTV